MGRYTKTFETISETLARIETKTIALDTKVTAVQQELQDMIMAVANWRVSTPLAVPRLTLSGTILNDTTEADIVAGGKTIFLSLTEDTWVATGGAFEAQRQPIIDKLVSGSSETNGWNAVRSTIVVGDVVRTSSTLVTILLPVLASYDVAAQETITGGGPAAALVTSVGDLAALPTFTIQPVVLGLTAPPVLITPTVITEDPSGNTYNFGDTEDFRFDIPLGQDINGRVIINGGRNGRIIGGKWDYTVDAPKTETNSKGVFKFQDILGTLLVEGLHIDTNGVYMDHFQINGGQSLTPPSFKLIIQNCFSEGIAGQFSGTHADFVECFGAAEKVTIENTTIVSGYAGVFLPYHGTNTLGGKGTKWGPLNLDLTRVNARVDEAIRAADSPNLDDRPDRLLYLQDGKTNGVEHGAVHAACNLVDVYCDTRATYPWHKMIMPTTGAAVWQSILNQPSGLPEYVTFPEGINTTGRVTEGAPPGGDFVDPANIGQSYTSPWAI